MLSITFSDNPTSINSMSLRLSCNKLEYIIGMKVCKINLNKISLIWESKRNTPMYLSQKRREGNNSYQGPIKTMETTRKETAQLTAPISVDLRTKIIMGTATLAITITTITSTIIITMT